MIQFYLSAFVLGVIVAIPPGSVTVIACQRALQYGFRNSLLFTIGSSLADIFYICLVYFGLASFLQDGTSNTMLWLLCGLLLLIIGAATVLSAVRGAGAEESGVSPLQSRPWGTFFSGIGVTLTNPMTIVGWIAIAGNFFIMWKDRAPAGGGYFALTIAVIMFGVLAWFVPLIYAASRLHRILNRKLQRYLIGFSGLCLIVFGIISLLSAGRMI
jgi:L-lysine exporter family protein LysE/ArgO